MGLDMYLNAKKFLSEYNDNDKEVLEQIQKIDNPAFKSCMKVRQVEFEAAYWRKANAIHKWFVDKCQDGIDECQETYVGLPRLKELLDTCEIVLADPTKASLLLPPQSGFFFGSTEVDNWYFDDLRYTVERLKELLAIENIEDYDFYYRSSW